MSLTPQQLSAELKTGPLSTQIAPYITSGDDGAIYAIMHTQNISAPGTITANDFAIWAVSNGQRAVIEDTANATADSMRSAALGLQDLLRGNLNQVFDLSNSSISSLLSAWLTAGKMTQAQHDSLVALGTKMISRAEQLGDPVTIPQIANALRP